VLYVVNVNTDVTCVNLDVMVLVDVLRSILHVGMNCVRGYGVNLQGSFFPNF
jgi:hypothetical protein